MKWTSIIFLILMACAPTAPEITTQPVVNEQPLQEKTMPAVEETPAMEEIVEEPVEAEEPEVTLSPEEKCKQDCQNTCAIDAQQACSQNERSQCRAMCGDIIDPSACTQACTYVHQQQNQCKTQFEKFCGNKCVELCH